MPGKPLTVLLSVDQSTYSEAAVDWYLADLHVEGNTVHLFISVEQPSAIGLEGFFQKSYPTLTETDYVHQGGYSQYQHAANQKRSEAEQLVQKYSEKLKSKNINANVITKITVKSVGQEIVDQAADKNAGLIVLGSRGLGQAKRTFLGSVSTYVLHHAPCNVAICPRGKSDEKVV